jgi:hypothetical protein
MDRTKVLTSSKDSQKILSLWQISLCSESLHVLHVRRVL